MHVYAFQILQVYFKDCRMYNDQSLQPIPVTTLKKEAIHTHAQDSITTATTHKNSNISAYDSNVLVWPCILGQQKHLVCFSVRFWSNDMKLTDFSTGHNRCITGHKQGKMEKTGCKIICGAPTTLAVKGLMMMVMNR